MTHASNGTATRPTPNPLIGSYPSRHELRGGDGSNGGYLPPE